MALARLPVETNFALWGKGPSACESRFAGAVAIFPVIRYAGIAEDEFDKFGKTGFGADIVGEDENAALGFFQADHRICGLAVVAAFVEAFPAGTVKCNDVKAGIEVGTLLVGRKGGKEGRELILSGDM